MSVNPNLERMPTHDYPLQDAVMLPEALPELTVVATPEEPKTPSIAVDGFGGAWCEPGSAAHSGERIVNEEFVLRNSGETVTIQSTEFCDISMKDGIAMLYENMTAEQRYTRFFRPVNEETAVTAGIGLSSTTDDKANYDLAVSIKDKYEDGTEYDKVIGHCGLVAEGKVVEIHMVVAAEYGGEGIATMMLEKILEAATAFRVPKIEADVLMANPSMSKIIIRVADQMGIPHPAETGRGECKYILDLSKLVAALN